MVSVTPGGKGGANSSSQRVPKSHQEGTVKGGPRVTGRSPLREACHVGLKSHRGEPARRSLPGVAFQFVCGDIPSQKGLPPFSWRGQT